jgi:uncharacterized phage-associated protein
MATVFDTASYIKRALHPHRPGKVALHKLLYACHRYAILRRGDPIFDAFCAALPLGPVFIPLLHNPEQEGNPNSLSSDEQAIVDTVLGSLGAMSGRALAARSHRNYYEWRIMREGMHENQVKSCGQYREIRVSLIRMLPEIQRRGSNIGNTIGLQ